MPWREKNTTFVVIACRVCFHETTQKMSENFILLRLLRMYFARKWELDQLCQNFGISVGWGLNTSKPVPSLRHRPQVFCKGNSATYAVFVSVSVGQCVQTGSYYFIWQLAVATSCQSFIGLTQSNQPNAQIRREVTNDISSDKRNKCTALPQTVTL